MPVVEIADLADPRLGDFARRTDVDLRRGTRHDAPLYLAESLLVLERALAAGHAPRAVLALDGAMDEVLALLVERDVPVFTGPGELLAELTGYQLHRGVVAAMTRPPLPDPAALIATTRRLVVLDDIVDPTNVGAVFRSGVEIAALARPPAPSPCATTRNAPPSASHWYWAPREPASDPRRSPRRTCTCGSRCGTASTRSTSPRPPPWRCMRSRAVDHARPALH